MKIPIVFSTDSKYCFMVRVAMESIMQHFAGENNAEFIVLEDETVTDEQKNVMRNISKFYKNADVKFINVGQQFVDAYDPKSRECVQSSATYYRLILAEFLEGYSKCIYLDADIIVNCDISELWNYDIGDCYIGGVRDVMRIQSYDRDYIEELGIKDISGYVNAGVLIFNLKKIRDDSLTEKFLEQLPKHYTFQDQDIINKVCARKISYMPFKYNYLIKKKENYIEYGKKHLDEQVNEVIAEPAIIHYAGLGIVYRYSDCDFFCAWWDMFRKLKDLDEVLKIYGNDIIDGLLTSNSMIVRKKEKYQESIRKNILCQALNSKYTYIYGAGGYGKRLKKWLLDKDMDVKGFLVSGETDEENVECFDSVLPRLYEENALIFIAVSDKYCDEIERHLNEKGYHNYMFANCLL